METGFMYTLPIGTWKLTNRPVLSRNLTFTTLSLSTFSVNDFERATSHPPIDLVGVTIVIIVRLGISMWVLISNFPGMASLVPST